MTANKATNSCQALLKGMPATMTEWSRAGLSLKMNGPAARRRCVVPTELPTHAEDPARNHIVQLAVKQAMLADYEPPP